MRCFLVLVALSVSCTVACGGTTVEGDDDVSAASGGSSSDDQGTGGSRSDGSGGFGATGGTCAAFDDAQPGHVDVTIRNETEELIWIGQDSVTCGQLPFFHVKDGGGVELEQAGDMCGVTCAEIRDGTTKACLAICLYPDAINLFPGESVRLGWDARFLADRTLPSECFPPEFDASECKQEKPVSSGRLTFSAFAGTTPDCSETTGTCGTCANPETGGCWWPATLVPDHEKFEASVGFDFDADAKDQLVEIVFKD